MDQFPFRDDSIAVANGTIDFLKIVERALDKLEVDAMHESQKHDAVTATPVTYSLVFNQNIFIACDHLTSQSPSGWHIIHGYFICFVFAEFA